jgi:hypothetical protein
MKRAPQLATHIEDVRQSVREVRAAAEPTFARLADGDTRELGAEVPLPFERVCGRNQR